MKVCCCCKKELEKDDSCRGNRMYFFWYDWCQPCQSTNFTDLNLPLGYRFELNISNFLRMFRPYQFTIRKYYYIKHKMISALRDPIESIKKKAITTVGPDLSTVKRDVTKYLQNSYNGETGYLSTLAINFKGVDLFSMKVTDHNNAPIERIMKITKRDYYEDFGQDLIMINYKRTNFHVQQNGETL